MSEKSKDDAVVRLGELAVAKNLLRLRFCIVCHEEMTDEICCTCEQPTVPRLQRN